MTPILFDVAKLLPHFKTFEDTPWPGCKGGMFNRAAVLKAIQEGRLEGECWSHPDHCNYDEEWDVQKHVHRVAYLVVHGWDTPIEMSFWPDTEDEKGGIVFVDGNHRFAAATIMGLPYITGYFSGDYRQAEAFFYKEPAEWISKIASLR
jgi:hypothetical protein